jgi:hypothetical protein
VKGSADNVHVMCVTWMLSYFPYANDLNGLLVNELINSTCRGKCPSAKRFDHFANCESIFLSFFLCRFLTVVSVFLCFLPLLPPSLPPSPSPFLLPHLPLPSSLPPSLHQEANRREVWRKRITWRVGRSREAGKKQVIATEAEL